ncbi:MAG: GNAT family N-acetyltransferase [Bacilli bacterium]
MIRFCNKNDLEFINNLGKELHSNYLFSINKFSNALVYVRDKKIIGFVSFSLLYERMEINDIVVLSDFRKMGIGKKLINSLIKYARKCNCNNITLEVSEKNLAGIKLYESTSFIVVAKRNNYYKDASALLMKIDLEVK